MHRDEYESKGRLIRASAGERSSLIDASLIHLKLQKHEKGAVTFRQKRTKGAPFNKNGASLVHSCAILGNFKVENGDLTPFSAFYCIFCPIFAHALRSRDQRFLL